ncbi:MAG: sugar ABC transporter permease, partial [Clostridia bacterium]|nr:sugar ABC transporter permease [Clostridia bacterium]
LEIGGMDYDFVFLSNFKYILKEDPFYTDTLISSLTTLAYSVPIIVALSLILGILLNQKFRGRVVMRAVFFLPVIIAAGIVLNILTTNINGQPPIIKLGATSTTMSDGTNYLDATALLEGLRFPAAVTEVMAKYITMIFNLLWRSGIQIILFISGLQTIPDSLYEVSKIEGASKWEEFWMVTFPMLRDVTLLVTVFTVVEEMVSTTNAVMSNAQIMIGQQRYDLPAAMIWFYFVCVLAICGVFLVPLFRSFKRKWD